MDVLVLLVLMDVLVLYDGCPGPPGPLSRRVMDVLVLYVVLSELDPKNFFTWLWYGNSLFFYLQMSFNSLDLTWLSMHTNESK
jgi:hypothetical protein